MLNNCASGLICFVGSKYLLFGSRVGVRIAKIFARLKNKFFPIALRINFEEQIDQMLLRIENVEVDDGFLMVVDIVGRYCNKIDGCRYC